VETTGRFLAITVCFTSAIDVLAPFRGVSRTLSKGVLMSDITTGKGSRIRFTTPEGALACFVGLRSFAP